jgi:hypothetical protein
VARNISGRRPAIDGRTTRHPDAISRRIRKRIEVAFVWARTGAGLRTARHRGLPRIDCHGRVQSCPSGKTARSRGLTPGLRPEPHAGARDTLAKHAIGGAINKTARYERQTANQSNEISAAC